MIVKGFRFGLLLQLALGPITLLIFQMAVASGFTEAMQGVAGVTLVDGLFVLAAVLGIGALINKDQRIKTVLSIGGAAVMAVFGLSIVLGGFGIELFPSTGVTVETTSHAFIRAAIMTGANPMTILFWAGVFSTKMAEEGMKREDMYRFGLGAVLTTPAALILVSLLGSTIKVFFSESMMNLLNILVGVLLIGFSLKLVKGASRH